MKIQTQKSGQVAIMLVLIIIILSIITTAAVAIGFSTARDTTTLTLGEDALMVAESGAENAILRLLRNPSYLGEPNLPIGLGSVTITVTGNGVKTITSKGVVGNMVRQIQVDVSMVDGALSVTNWQEI